MENILLKGPKAKRVKRPAALAEAIEFVKKMDISAFLKSYPLEVLKSFSQTKDLLDDAETKRALQDTFNNARAKLKAKIKL